MIADIAQHIAIAHRTLPASINENESERILAEQSHTVHDGELPNLEIEFSSDLSLLQKLASQGKNSFAGLLQEGDSVSEPLSLISLRMIGDSKEPRVVVLRVPVTPAFLRTIAPDLGVIQLNLMENYEGTGPPGVLYSSGDKKYRVAERIVASNRKLQAAVFWLDSSLKVFSCLALVYSAQVGYASLARSLIVIYHTMQSLKQRW